MRRLIPLVFLAALPLSAQSAQAAGHEPYPWCAQYTGRSANSTNCGFDTVGQCRAAVFGVGGYCMENPMYHGPETRLSRRRAHG